MKLLSVTPEQLASTTFLQWRITGIGAIGIKARRDQAFRELQDTDKRPIVDVVIGGTPCRYTITALKRVVYIDGRHNYYCRLVGIGEGHRPLHTVIDVFNEPVKIDDRWTYGFLYHYIGTEAVQD